uniref:pre-peptidase C-terminal domain-containing protein n=1 Tax=Sphingosinicella terrae TaxID=2172047 RepID=UPI0025488519
MASPYIRANEFGQLIPDDHHHKAPLEPIAGDYTLSDLWNVAAPPTLADEPNGTGIVVGGSASGAIDFSGDVDIYSVTLVAGQTYSVSLRGTGAAALTDSFLQIGSPTDTLVIQDDDGGNGLYSVVTFTASVSGTYSIVASSFANPGDPGLGTYTVDVWQRGADTVGATNGTAVAIDLGTVLGFRETGTDVDRYAVTLEAGQLYTFEVAGGADYNTNWLSVPTGELDTILRLRNASGTIIASNDDLSFPSDISSGFSFLATASGTFYLDVTAYSGQTGGYVLDYGQVDLSTLDPLDSIIWGSAGNMDPGDDGILTVYFAEAGENFGETGDNGVDPLPSFGWNAFEQQQVMLALEEYSKILGFEYQVTTDAETADFRLVTTTSEQYGAYFYPQDPTYGTQQGIGAFNVDSGAWTFDQQQALVQGGYAFAVILHEFGHAHGLSHPHDRGGGSDVMLGVSGSTGSYGLYDLNQGVYTVMSYNDSFPRGPNGETPFTVANVDSGWSGTLSAFDIAALQERYGIINAYATGNNVYELGDANDPGVYYETIWDTGGTDEIRYSGN